ncbi:putative tail fiber protein, partial [Escherichia coli 07798]
IPLNKNRR